MSMQNQKRRNIGRLFAGAALTFVVSFATAAMVALLPGVSDQKNNTIPNQTHISALDDYVLLHQARSTVVPSYMRIDVPDRDK